MAPEVINGEGYGRKADIWWGTGHVFKIYVKSRVILSFNNFVEGVKENFDYEFALSPV